VPFCAPCIAREIEAVETETADSAARLARARTIKSAEFWCAGRIRRKQAARGQGAIRQAWVEEKGMRVFSLWDPSNPMLEVDLFAEHPIDFEELWSRAEIVKLTHILRHREGHDAQ
jgi:hypothetical protein